MACTTGTACKFSPFTKLSFSPDSAVSSSIFVGEIGENLMRNDPDKSALSIKLAKCQNCNKKERKLLQASLKTLAKVKRIFCENSLVMEVNWSLV